MTFMLNSLLFCSLGWNLDGPKTRKGSFDIHVSSIIKLKILLNYRLEFFWKNLRRNYHVKFQFPFETDLLYVLCAPWTENIAVPLCFLFVFFYQSINLRSCWRKRRQYRCACCYSVPCSGLDKMFLKLQASVLESEHE